MNDQNSIRLVTRNFLSLGSGETIARLIAFGATVFVAQRLGTSSFGALQLAAAIVLYFYRVVDVGFELGLGAREVAARTVDPGQLASSATTVRGLIAVFCVTGLVVFGLTVMPEPEGSVLAVQAFTLLAVGIGTRWLHVGFERTALVAAARTIGEIVMVAIVLLFVRRPADLLRVPMAQVAGDMLASGILLVGAARIVRMRPRIDWTVLAPFARRGVHLASSALFSLMIYNADLVFLRVFRDSATVGLYAAAYALISFLSNLSMAYGLTLIPTLTRLARDRVQQRSLFQAVNAQALLVSLAIAVGGCLLAPGIIRFVFGREYGLSAPALAILIWSIPFAVLQNLAISGLLSEGREGVVMKLTGTAAGLNLVLNFALVPRWGMAGAAVATTITEAFRLVLASVAARPLGFALPPLTRLVRPVVPALVMAAVLWPLRSAGLLIAIPGGAAAWLLVLTLAGGIHRHPGELPTLDV